MQVRCLRIRRYLQIRYLRIKRYMQIPYKLTNKTLDGGTAIKYETSFVGATIFQDRKNYNMCIKYHVYIAVIIYKASSKSSHRGRPSILNIFCGLELNSIL